MDIRGLSFFAKRSHAAEFAVVQPTLMRVRRHCNSSQSRGQSATQRIAIALLLLVAGCGFNACGGGSGAITTTRGIASGGGGANPVVIATAMLPDAVVNVKYTVALAVAGGTAPYTFTISTGSLPSGLMIDNTGTITGTALAVTPAPVTFTVKVTDSSATPQSTTQNFTLTVDAAALPLTFVTPATLT